MLIVLENKNEMYKLDKIEGMYIIELQFKCNKIIECIYIM